MAPKRTPVLNGLLLGGVATLAACGGGAEQFKMGLLAVQASPPAAPPPSSFAPPPRRTFDPPPPRREDPPPPTFAAAPPPPAAPVEEISNARVQLRGERIEIRQQVKFKTWQATLQRRSYALLDEIADVLKRNPQVRRVEIQGHTSITKNRRERLGPLSQRRANAVRDYLIEQGVAPDRLVARGYGYKRPIADNSTAQGRSTNRRVEFVIIEQGGSAPAATRSPPPSRTAPAPAPAADDDFGDDDLDDLDDFDDEEDF